MKRAFLYGDVDKEMYIELPEEDPRKDGKKWVGRLLKAMYGTRGAPKVWQREVAKVMRKLGFRASVGTPCLYFHDARDIMVVAHVDDFLVGADREQIDWFVKALGNEFEIKSEVLGSAKDEVREAKFLGRKIRWTDEGIEYEGDGKLRNDLLTEWSMEDCKSVMTPGEKD